MNRHARLIRAIVLLGLLALPAAPASANVLGSNDFDGIDNLEKRTLSLSEEINTLAPNTPAHTSICLFSLDAQLNKFSDDLHPLVLLVRLASDMTDVTDEKAVIHMLSIEAPLFLKHLQGRQEGINAMVTHDCPQDSLVAAAAQIILRIYDEAGPLVGSIVKKIGASSP